MPIRGHKNYPLIYTKPHEKNISEDSCQFVDREKTIRGQKRQKSRGIPRLFSVVVLVLLVNVVISSILSCSLVVVSRVSFA